MSRISLTFSVLRSEIICNVISITGSGLQQFVFPGRLIVSNGTLQQMAEAVQLVMITQIRKNAVFSI